MNILIPASGLGKRFTDVGYSMPKPLISILGEPMICRVIQHLRDYTLKPEDQIHIIYLQEFDKYQFAPIIKRTFPDLNINFIRLKQYTRGPAETILCGLNQIDSLSEPVLCVDYDMLFLESVRHEGNYICYFETDYDKPIYSYIKHSHSYIKNVDEVTEIKEKQKISNSACAGAYGFVTGKLLKQCIELVLDDNQYSEFFLSHVYEKLIQRNYAIYAHLIEGFDCIGTPQQLQTYCMIHDQEKKRFCFDLDNTLVTYPKEAGNYGTVEPIIKNIKLVQYLHKQGHTIIIQTARKMKSGMQNAGVATKLAYISVTNTLTKYNIPFDELHFGKPQADFYIDDLSVKPWDIEKETGFYNGEIEAREFNRIEYGNEWITKETPNSGELYWYKNIPEAIKEHFPKLIFESPFTIERLNCVNFSYLLCNGSLTKANLQNLLDTLDKVHESIPVQQLHLNALDIAEDNYTKKITNRFKDNDYPYQEEALYYFKKVAKIKHEPRIGTIHGDPVFSNVFLCENNLIKFIDMRGKQGDVETIFGDIFYDYAKVYQSLCGYDFILNDQEINYPYLNELREYFELWFTQKFVNVDLAHITAGLLFSLIPLHTDIEKQKKYFELMKTLV